MSGNLIWTLQSPQLGGRDFWFIATNRIQFVFTLPHEGFERGNHYPAEDGPWERDHIIGTILSINFKACRWTKTCLIFTRQDLTWSIGLDVADPMMEPTVLFRCANCGFQNLLWMWRSNYDLFNLSTVGFTPIQQSLSPLMSIFLHHAIAILC